MKNNRPIFLSLTQIHFPVMAIVSVLHRISGVTIFLALPFFLYLFHGSMSLNNYQLLVQLLQNPFVKLINLAILSAVCFHLIAGIRHLLMDMHIGETLEGGRKSAIIVIFSTMVLIIFVGFWIW